MTPIYTISPKNKYKVLVGWLNLAKREAEFRITPLRYFQKADAIGIDESVFKRKSIQWCKYYQFDLWDGRSFKIKKDDFMRECWIYPGKEDGVAPKGEFDPKLVIGIEKATQLSEKAKVEKADQILKVALT